MVSARKLLAVVPVPQPFSLDVYLRRIEQVRRTKIFVEPAKGLLSAGAPCGLWVHVDGADFIFHAPSSSSAYVEHIVRHELGHLLFNHSGTSQSMSPDYMSRLLPGLDPAAALTVLGRDSYGTEQERQAETFARVLAAAIRGQGPRDNEATGPAGAIDRLLG